MLDRIGHLRLSDFGLCKPLDCSVIEGEDFSRGGVGREDITSTAPKRSQQEQLQHWQKNRRMLVCTIHSSLIRRFFIWCVTCSCSWCKHLQAYSTVGTPDYIAPEVLLKKGYGMECDWYVHTCLITLF